MNRKIRNSIWTVAIATASLTMPMTACSSDDRSDEVRLQGKNEVNNMPEAERQQTETKLCQGRIEDGQVINDCYYLQDCYPPQFIDDETVKANRIRRAAQWEKFTKYLESKGKLRK